MHSLWTHHRHYNTALFEPWPSLEDSARFACSVVIHTLRFSLLRISQHQFAEQGHHPCVQPPTWRARPPYLYPPVTRWPSYTPRHWVPFSSQGYGGGILTCLHSGLRNTHTHIYQRMPMAYWTEVGATSSHAARGTLSIASWSDFSFYLVSFNNFESHIMDRWRISTNFITLCRSAVNANM
jgi:hypothetical protein